MPTYIAITKLHRFNFPSVRTNQSPEGLRSKNAATQPLSETLQTSANLAQHEEC